MELQISTTWFIDGAFFLHPPPVSPTIHLQPAKEPQEIVLKSFTEFHIVPINLRLTMHKKTLNLSTISTSIISLNSKLYSTKRYQNIFTSLLPSSTVYNPKTHGSRMHLPLPTALLALSATAFAIPTTQNPPSPKRPGVRSAPPPASPPPTAKILPPAKAL